MKLILLAITLTSIWTITFAQAQTGNSISVEADIAAIRDIIPQTEKAINEADPEGIMAHYSKDILVSYPGIADTDYKTFSESYKHMLRPGIVTSTTPTIEEILVSGDLAIIRMIWETTITETVIQKTSRRKARDLQVWKREAGNWKFIRGMWYHMK